MRGSLRTPGSSYPGIPCLVALYGTMLLKPVLEKRENLSRGKKQMVEPCARVDVLVARLGRVEGVVRIVYLGENILEEKTFELKIL